MKIEKYICARCSEDVEPKRAGEFIKFWCENCHGWVIGKSILVEVNNEKEHEST